MQRRNIYIHRDNCYLYLGLMTQHKYSYLNIWSQTKLFWILALSLLGFVNVNHINYQWFSLVLYHLTVSLCVSILCLFLVSPPRNVKAPKRQQEHCLFTHAESPVSVKMCKALPGYMKVVWQIFVDWINA